MIVIVGAGIAGLLAAQTLKRAGKDVLVVDKGRGVGGRMATRRVGAGVIDHGAQFFTVRSERFGALVAEWQAAGLVTEWTHGFADAERQWKNDGYPRHERDPQAGGAGARRAAGRACGEYPATG